MAETFATSRTHFAKHIICLFFEQDQYLEIVDDSERFRRHLDELFQTQLENFPPNFQDGYTMKDIRYSKKLNLPLRRITLHNGDIYTIRPSFVLRYMTAIKTHTNEEDDYPYPESKKKALLSFANCG